MDSNHTCLTIIDLDSALKKDANYYLQVFYKKRKYIEKNVIRHMMSLKSFKCRLSQYCRKYKSIYDESIIYLSQISFN